MNPWKYSLNRCHDSTSDHPYRFLLLFLFPGSFSSFSLFLLFSWLLFAEHVIRCALKSELEAADFKWKVPFSDSDSWLRGQSHKLLHRKFLIHRAESNPAVSHSPVACLVRAPESRSGSGMMRSWRILCRSCSLSICCCLRSSAAFSMSSLRSFFLRSGVRKPFLAFFIRPASSRRFRTSAFLRSRSATRRAWDER